MSIQVTDLSKSFGDPPHKVLHEMSFEIKNGEYVSIWGRSGSGKTTLLYILSTLDSPTTGQILIDGKNPNTMSVQEIHDFRNHSIGFIFQFHYLLSELTALENILLPVRKTGEHEALQDRALEMMSLFGLKGLEHRLPSQLSGGEQQRVAIARALIRRPRYLFADEPTGNLDSKNGEIVMALLKEANQTWGTSIVLVTHERTYAQQAHRRIELIDGRLASHDAQISL
ncbi:MAG: ATP-binding protein [Bdellovibrio sp. CG10_big_fil_rev_8_21_14_0_10_47_8]|nr:MAG: ATP-binding protein [Bdellovibrio sp. CG10_big_fil_rev_8_21_14_0_10_47_8]